MTATLPADPDTERLARKLAADSGAPVADVVRDAIKAHAVRQMKLLELRATIDASIADPRRLTAEEVRASLAESRAERAKHGL